MDKENNNQIYLDLTRGDYMLLQRHHKDEYASLQGKPVDYATWCKIMNCLEKLKSHNKSYKYSNMVAEPVVALD